MGRRLVSLEGILKGGVENTIAETSLRYPALIAFTRLASNAEPPEMASLSVQELQKVAKLYELALQNHIFPTSVDRSAMSFPPVEVVPQGLPRGVPATPWGVLPSVPGMLRKEYRCATQ